MANKRKAPKDAVDFIPAIFLGKNGLDPKRPVFMPSVHNFWIPIDMDGNIMDPTDEKGEYSDPTVREEFMAKQVLELYAGESVMLPGPGTDAKSWQNAQDVELFAKPSFKKQIKAWMADGKKPYEIREELRKVGGLIGKAQPKPEPKVGG